MGRSARAGAHARLLVLSRPAKPADRKVSVHVPAYNEPAHMLIETLDALARLDYPNFEVIVVDNNTRDEAVWRPVEAHCQRLGERFRFFHVSPLAGFKAGALNFALRHTAADAEVIAVIDSDYQVAPNWLSDLVPSFDNPRIAIVQAPQDYHDEHDSAFKAMCYAEYRGFFYIGMITRNERNAIIHFGRRRLGGSGASPRTPSSDCACSKPATRRSTSRRATAPGSCPIPLSTTNASASVVVMRHANTSAPCDRRCCARPAAR